MDNKIRLIDVTNRDGVQTSRLGLAKLEKTVLAKSHKRTANMWKTKSARLNFLSISFSFCPCPFLDFLSISAHTMYIGILSNLALYSKIIK